MSGGQHVADAAKSKPTAGRSRYPRNIELVWLPASAGASAHPPQRRSLVHGRWQRSRWSSTRQIALTALRIWSEFRPSVQLQWPYTEPYCVERKSGAKVVQKIGYARVSTTGQNLDRQLGALRAQRCDVVFKEKASGRSLKKRPQLLGEGH